MKKFYLVGTDESLEFGDFLELDLTKENKKGKEICEHIECKFIPELVPLLIEEGIIEEREVKKEKKLTPYEELLRDNAVLTERIEALEKAVASLKRNGKAA